MTADDSVLWAATDLITPLAIRAAATLRLADHVAAGATSAAGLAAATGADREGVARLVRFLGTTGVLVIDGDQIRLGDLGELLLSEHPSRIRDWLDLDGFGGRMDRALFGLLDAVRHGRPVYAEAHGRELWADLDAHPAIARSFDEVMASEVGGEVPFVVEAYDWSGVGQVVDVGGGTGTLIAAIAEAHPHLSGTVVDLPGPAARAVTRFRDRGLGDRCTAVAGSFFDPLPSGADVYILARVLHDWPDADAARILTRCAEAAGHSGRVLVVDGVITDETGAIDPGVASMDLRMLTLVGGRERTLADYAALAETCGLALGEVTRLPLWGRALLELRTPR